MNQKAFLVILDLIGDIHQKILQNHQAIKQPA